MAEAAAATPAPEPPPTLEELVAAQNVLLERLLAVFGEANRLAARPMTQDDRNAVVMLARRGADIEGEMFQVKDRIRKGAARRSLEQAREIMAAQMAPAEPAPRPRRHRAPRGQRPLYPRSLKGLVPLGAAVTAARHSWPAAHPALAGTIATAAAGIAVTTAAVVPHAAATFGSGSPARTPAPAASIWSAVPAPVTGPPQIASAATHPKGGAGSPRTLTVLAPPSLPAYVPPDAPDPSVGQDPASQPPPVQGTLSVSTTALDLTGTGTGTLAVTCSGGDCQWHVVAGGVLGADVRQGDLRDGESVTVTLSVDAAALLLAGSGTVTVWPGDIAVTVSWSVPVVPAADPSALPSGVPPVSVSVP